MTSSNRTAALLTALTLCATASALVAQNVPLTPVKRPPSKKKTPPSRPASPKPAARPAPRAVARPAPRPSVTRARPKPANRASRPKPTPRPPAQSPAVVSAALRWMEQEAQSLASVEGDLRIHALPVPDGTVPANPFARSAAPAPRPLSQYTIQVRMLRTDGRVVGPAFDSKAAAFALSDGERSLPAAPGAEGYRLTFTTPPPSFWVRLEQDWEFADTPETGRTVPLDWRAVPGVPLPVPQRPEAPSLRPLAVGDEDTHEARQELVSRARHTQARPPSGPYPTPAALCRRAMDALMLGRSELQQAVEASQALADRVPALAPDEGERLRRQAWRNLECVVIRLQGAESDLNQASRASDSLVSLDRPGGQAGPQEVLGSRYQRLQPQRLQEHLLFLRASLVQFEAEALWWQSQLENPAEPDRAAAIACLDPERLGKNPPQDLVERIAVQRGEYRRAEMEERAARSGPAAGESPAGPVAKTLSVGLTVRRKVVPLSFRLADLREGDECLLARGLSEEPFPLTLDAENGLWKGRLPEPAIAAGGRLIVRRETPAAQLQRVLPLEGVDAYEAGTRVMSLPPWQLRQFNQFRLAAAPGEVATVLSELPPIQTGGAMAGIRETSLLRKTSRLEADGTWWVGPSDTGLSWRLRTPPKYVAAAGSGLDRLRGWALVDAIRLERPESGHVAGAGVGITRAELEAALGSGVPGEGSVSYLGGGLKYVLQEDRVVAILVHARLSLLVQKPIPPPRPGGLERVDPVRGHIWVRKGPGLPLEKGTLLDLVQDGLRLFERDTAQVWAEVIDSSGELAVCKLWRTGETGQPTDETSAVLRCIPAPETDAVSVRLLQP